MKQSLASLASCGVSVLLIRSFEQPSSEKRFDPRERQPRREARLHQRRLRFAQRDLRLEQIENRGRTFPVPRVLYAVVLARDGNTDRGELDPRARRRVSVICLCDELAGR